MALPDPLKLYREAITRFENGINALAARHIDAKEVGLVIDHYSRVSHGLQHLSQTSLERLYKRMDLPSRGEVDALATALRRVEDKLDQLLPASRSAAIAPRPPRTRRPMVEASPAPVKPASKRKRKAGSDDDSAT
ncbi:hypothetical protein D3C77_37220 [compost metagenome]|uniref:hypothetical protein n=1 Tax=Pseudomonas TaxID=286 RepID=UPI0004068C2A|nr:MULTISPECIES: hypothetical protein [Pseudomonas]MCW2271916.1 hypothetical protein [Pseudomonas sp. JUb96]PRA63067.1 hypothetical protein CQ065_14345 [Pseudomonas sp. MYb187]